MGLFNKLKNALFEEEEIDLESAPDKIVIKDEEAPTERKVEVKKEEIPLENERELFKAENTFKFPEFDEEEFVTSYEPPKVKEPVKLVRKVDYERKPENVYYESKVKITRENPSRRERVVTKEEKTKKVFRPSPVISPVYGILDKNYKKEDIVTVEKNVKVKKTIDVDMVRKKAFGTLEDDIEKTLNEPIENFYNENTKSIDELLNDSIDETIEIKCSEPVEVENYEESYNDFSNNIEEELDKVDENLEVIEEVPKREETKEYVEEDTLENDLFDLIDSMYDNREEE